MVGEKLLVTEACLSAAHCQQGNRGPHLKWLTFDLCINLTQALGLVLALGRGMDAAKDRNKELLAWPKSEYHFSQSLTSFSEVCCATVDLDWLCPHMN